MLISVVPSSGVALSNPTFEPDATVLGTPSSGTLTSCTGLPISTGLTGAEATEALGTSLGEATEASGLGLAEATSEVGLVPTTSAAEATSAQSYWLITVSKMSTAIRQASAAGVRRPTANYRPASKPRADILFSASEGRRMLRWHPSSQRQPRGMRG